MDAVRVPHQPVWTRIQAETPSVLMLLGDQIYMDWGLAGTDWRETIRRDPVTGLQAYAEEMHLRYARQWAVPEFQALVCGFEGRRDPARLLVTWDDHDYAWNNALGVDGDDKPHRHGVPAPVKAVSLALHRQFVHQLRGAPLSSPYPALPADLSMPADAGGAGLFWQGGLGPDGALPAICLDTRWHRQARGEDARLLGDAQTTALLQAASSPKGLLVVAGGTPMHHRYWVSQQSWHGSGEEVPYAEYALLTDRACRPVLYLSGDVHRNAFSGVLPRLSGTPSTVVQVLSSGAAIGRYGPKRFAPSFGVVEVAALPDHSGRVRIALMAQDRKGEWQTHPPENDLTYSASAWTSPPETEAFAHVEAAADAEPLCILSARPARHPIPPHLSRKDLHGFDQAFAEESPAAEDHAQALTLQAVAEPDLKLEFHPSSLVGAEGETSARAQVRQAFEQALALGKQSVVLFIHGFGKTFSTSASQAYDLRASHPTCEPLLFSWFAGKAGGGLAALWGMHDALRSATQGAPRLATVLRAFGAMARDPRYEALATVVVGRSAGSVALNEALRTGEPGFNGDLKGVTRVVLSAPLLKTGDFNARGGLAWLTDVPVVVTRNRNDQTLRWADKVDGTGDMLGLEGEFETDHPDAWCLDFTDSAWVGQLHDHLLPFVNEAQHRLNGWLLTDKRPFRPDHPALAPFIREVAGREVLVK